MSRTKAIVVDERREIELGEAKGDDTLFFLGIKEGKPVVGGLVVGVVGVVLMVLSFLLPS